MVSMQKVLKWGGLAAVLAATTGCVVLPYGHGGHRHGRGGDRHDYRAPEQAPIMREAPREGRQRPGY